jgi:hypothetical protein
MGFIQRFLMRKKILRSGRAQRVIFYFPGERISYLDDAHVTLYHGGVVEVEHQDEHVVAHLHNTAIVWQQAEFARVILPKDDAGVPLVVYKFD